MTEVILIHDSTSQLTNPQHMSQRGHNVGCAGILSLRIAQCRASGGRMPQRLDRSESLTKLTRPRYKTPVTSATAAPLLYRSMLRQVCVNMCQIFTTGYGQNKVFLLRILI